MRKIILFLAIITAVSCETIQYDGETRLVVEGKVVDKNQNPVPDVDIEIVAYSNPNSKAEDLISYGNTDASGNFQLIIPAPKDTNDYLKVIVNQIGNGRQQKSYNSILRKDFSNYKLALLPIVLYANSDLSQLVVNSQHNNSNFRVSNVRLTNGFQSEDVFEFNPVGSDYIDQEYFEYYFKVLKNQMVSISYKTTDFTNPAAPTITEHTESFFVNNEPTFTYTIQY